MVRHNSSEWQEFEQLVARIERDAGPLGITVTSPDRITCKITGRKREVDASIRSRVGTTEIVVTIECRKRHPRQDVTWIEQLAAKRDAIGAACTLAVSCTGFSANAVAVAHRHGIQLRRLAEVSVAEISQLLRLDFVLFTHKKAAPVRIALRLARDSDWSPPDPRAVDLVLPDKTDPFAPIFKNIESGTTWSLNDLWRQLQETIDQFAEIIKGDTPVIKTVCFPYPGNVTVETPEGPKMLGDVLLSMSLWLELEQVWLHDAAMVEYISPDGTGLQRVEFTSQRRRDKDWRLSLQLPKHSTDISEIKTEMNQPPPKDEKHRKV